MRLANVFSAPLIETPAGRLRPHSPARLAVYEAGPRLRAEITTGYGVGG
jgi:hypothetical protein